MPGLTGVVAVAAGDHYNVVAKSDGTVHAFGKFRPFGQVAGLANIVGVAQRGATGAALRSDGVVFSWGGGGAIAGDGTYVDRSDPILVMNEDGAGSIDRDDWYLDLDSATTLPIPAALLPKALAVAQRSIVDGGTSLTAAIKYRAADYGRGVKNFVLASVPPSFLDQVQTVPGTPSAAEARAKGKTTIYVQLTPNGWSEVTGRLIAYSHAVANASGSSARILENVPIPAGARFCVAYGESAETMLGSASLRDVLASSGALSEGCIPSGVYIEGPAESRATTAVTFTASVVALSPTGQVQFLDGSAALGSPQAVTPQTEAVSRASLTTAALAPGDHAIGASYSGNNPSMSAAAALRHRVLATPSAVVSLMGPSGSVLGCEVSFVATVAGDNPTGTIEYRDGESLVATEPLVLGSATLRTSALAAGNHSISARYGGDARNAAATSAPLAHAVAVPVVPAITLSATPHRVAAGEAITLAASVSPGTFSGSMEVRDGDETVVGRAMVRNAAASLTVGALLAGSHYLRARLLDDGGNVHATSPAVFVSVAGETNVTAAPAALAFSRQPAHTASPPQVVTVTNTGTASVTVSSVNASSGFTATHGCTTLAAGAACSVNVTFAPVGPGEFAGTLTISTSAGTVVVQLAGIAGANPPRLVNIATRMQVLTGDNVMIGGFIIGGSSPKTVVVRARGPSMTAAGVPNVLPNPVLNLYSGQTVIGSNDDWGTAANASTLQASGFAPPHFQESAIYTTLNPGPYTAIVSGAHGITGVGIVEVFEVDAVTTPLINIATRGAVQTGDNVMIGGFIIQGDGPKTVVVRARGPSLAAAGVPNVLMNPVLNLYSGQTVIASNDDWQTAGNAATLQSSGFAPADARESAIYITLNPGAYTAIV
ncbi:MAG TPA: Ig-like domain repeat protein, partial [Acetobacteraceae bacterium]|nr:Ig-like domain repeat protein [Acetobacteraceae bacterium]